MTSSLLDRIQERVYGKRILGVVDVASTAQRTVAVCVDVPEERRERYRSLLPAGTGMPSTPRLYVYLTDILANRVLGPYRELGVCLAATCDADRSIEPGRSSWAVAAMVVDGRRARWGGLAVGYPKVMGHMALGRTPGGWAGTVERDGEAVVDLEWAPADVHAPWFDEVAVDDPFYLFRGATLNIMEFTPEPETEVTRTPGTATVTVGSDEPWAELVGSRTFAAPALFVDQRGPGYLTRRGS